MEINLQELLEICIKELNIIGIDLKGKDIQISISKRNNKRYGCCKTKVPDENYKKIIKKDYKYIIKYENYKKYNIEISRWVLNLNEDIIKNTIIHELIHCMPYCNNHGKMFKYYANLVNVKLGYDIKRLGNKKEDFEKSNIEFIQAEEYKYKIKCKDCDKIFYRKRISKNFIKTHRCGKCLGKLKIIESK